jgi:hypothetical protein
VLRSIGFVVSDDGNASEIALVRQDKGHLYPCTWLELGRMDGRPVAWLKGTEAAPAFIPEADLNSRRLGPFSPEQLDEGYELLERGEGGLETHRNKATGELLYIVRGEAASRSLSPWRRLWRRMTTGAR